MYPLILSLLCNAETYDIFTQTTLTFYTLTDKKKSAHRWNKAMNYNASNTNAPHGTNPCKPTEAVTVSSTGTHRSESTPMNITS